MNFLVITIGVVLLFDFINGFHDSANSIATIVSTKELSPLSAVGLATVCNFLAFLIFPLKVATTIGKGVIDPDIVTLNLIFSAVIAAIIWNLITWWAGIPSSSSHTLVGGLIGAAIAVNGPDAVIFSGVAKITLFIVIAPFLGMLISIIISIMVMWIVRNQTPFLVDRYFRKLQLLSAAAFSLGHGGNDAQKSMGVI
jgi:inorganic phosphate transporter, PiT family